MPLQFVLSDRISTVKLSQDFSLHPFIPFFTFLYLFVTAADIVFWACFSFLVALILKRDLAWKTFFVKSLKPNPRISRRGKLTSCIALSRVWIVFKFINGQYTSVVVCML